MYFMLLLFIGLNIGQCQKLIVSEQPMNWKEAAEYCMERNSTLVHPGNRPPNVTDYWTIQHKRISPWIHVIGCFNESLVHSYSIQNFTLPSMSVSLCQQRCPDTLFGIQNFKCICLLGEAFVTSTVDPRLCHTSCSASPDNIFQKCGGGETYSIYKTGNLSLIGEGKGNEDCYSIYCYMSHASFVRLECSNTWLRCLCKDADTLYNTLNWTQCVMQCEVDGNYMHGVYDLSDPKKTCEGIHIKILHAWIGLAKEIYITSFIGRNDFYFLVLQCTACNENKCALQSCSEKKYAVCNKQDTVPTTQWSSSVSMTTDVGSESITEITTLIKTSTILFSRPTTLTPISQKGFSKEEGAFSPTTIIIVASAATFITISVLIFVTLLCKKKRREIVKERNFVNGTIGRSETELDTYSGIRSVVHPSKTVDHQKPSGDIEKKDRNMHYDDDYDHLQDNFNKKKSNSNIYSTMSNCTSGKDYQTEGNEMYNHLRQASIKATEDIYNHMIEENDCEYGLADPTAIEDSDVFCNYDHFILPMTLNKSHGMSNDYDKMDT